MKIITAVVNNIDFIELQAYTLRKFFKGDYEFIVFNDAKDFPDFTNGGNTSIRNDIREFCHKENIQCIDIPNDQHLHNLDAAIRCADSMNFILRYQLENPDQYLLLDSDMFLIKEFSIDRYAAYDCAIVLQRRNENTTNYMWNGIYYFNMHKMRDLELLDWTPDYNCDVGARMHTWLTKQMKDDYMPFADEIRWTTQTFHTDRIYFIKHLWSCSWDATERRIPELLPFLETDVRNKNGKYFCEIFDDVFLHYRAGGNWMNEGMTTHAFLTQKLKQTIYKMS